jgi:hypothetical protein
MVEGKSVIWVCERQRRTLFLLGLFVYLSLKTRFRDNNQPTRHNSWCGTAEHVYTSTISTANHAHSFILHRAHKNVVADLTSLDRETDAALSIRDRSTVRCFEC